MLNMMRADRSHSVDWIGAVCRAAEREIPRSGGTCRSQAADDQHQWAIARRARSQRRIRIAISSSRPMIGVRWRCPAWRPPPLARTNRNSITSSDTPFNLLTDGVALHRRRPARLCRLCAFDRHWDISRLPYDGEANRWFDAAWLVSPRNPARAPTRVS
jgi:hypothetical protein